MQYNYKSLFDVLRGKERSKCEYIFFIFNLAACFGSADCPNGGVCVGADNCKCPEQYGGKRCLGIHIDLFAFPFVSLRFDDNFQ